MLDLWRRWGSWKLLRKLLIVLAVLSCTLLLYGWRLGSLTPGLSAAEAAARLSSQQIHYIVVNPINAPQRLLQYGLQAAGQHGAFWIRTPSVIFAIALLSLFYLLAKVWFGRIIGLLATVVLATTPWVALLARNATPDILLLAPIILLLGYHWLRRSSDAEHRLRWSLMVIAAAICLYIPGMVWLFILGGAMFYKQLLAIAKNVNRRDLVITLLTSLFILAPLVYAIIQDLSVGKALVLWPAHFVGVFTTLKSLAWAGLALVWRTPYHVPTIIGRLPMLDITQIALIIFGSYAMWTRARRQLYPLLGLIGFGLVAAAIDQNLLLISFALPALAILVAAGLRYLYVEWRSVFPHNPIPRALAIVLMVVLVSLHVLLGVRYSLVAWPHTVATHHTYVIK